MKKNNFISLQIGPKNNGYEFKINGDNHNLTEQDLNDCYGVARGFVQLAQENPKLIFDAGEKALKEEARFLGLPETTSTVN